MRQLPHLPHCGYGSAFIQAYFLRSTATLPFGGEPVNVLLLVIMAGTLTGVQGDS